MAYFIYLFNENFYRARYINCLQAFTHAQPISCVALHPNQVDFLIGDEVGNIIRWDIRANKSEPVPFVSILT